MNIKLPLKSDEMGSYIFDADGDIFAQVRGWGHLQYLGEKEGIQEQRDRQEFIVKACNAYKAPPAESEEAHE